MRTFTIKNGKINCPKVCEDKTVRDCFGCSDLRSVVPKDGGSLQCSFTSETYRRAQDRFRYMVSKF